MMIIFDIKIKYQGMKFKDKLFIKGFKTKYTIIKITSAKSNIKSSVKGWIWKKKLDKWFRTKYITLKIIRTKFHIKIKCEEMKF